jgi:hypothetical protein
MSQRVSISATEAADRLAIRELIEAYARCADRRDAEGQMALFTAKRWSGRMLPDLLVVSPYAQTLCDDGDCTVDGSNSGSS